MSLYEKKGWFRLELPEGWTADEGEEPLTFVSPRGEGMVQVTAMDPRPLKPGQKLDPALLLLSFLRQSGVDLPPDAARSRSERGMDWAEASWTEESQEGPVAWRGWMATNHDLLAFLTYAGPAAAAEADRADVDALLSSFELR
jgi:hypothetical protein